MNISTELLIVDKQSFGLHICFKLF